MWKTDFIVVNIKLARPQALWKTCGKPCLPVEKKTKEYFSTFSTGKNFCSACGNVENFV
jgi:hypothetical protein